MVKKHNKTPFTIGICAYNEEATIGRLLQVIQKERFKKAFPRRIIVVASGCTDNTEGVVKEFKKKDSRIRLISESERKGKSSAVNLIIGSCRDEIIVLASADIIPKGGSIERLVLRLSEEEVGMVGSRPIPRNKPIGLIGYAVNLQWRLHHLISLKKPKMGEMVAFKKIFKRINPTSAVDEAIVECLVATQGFKIVYEPKAVIYNYGPRTVRDFLRQRRRIYAGHLATKKHYGYAVSTFEVWKMMPLVIKIFKLNKEFLIYTPLVIAMEVVARAFGFFDYYLKLRSHTVWNIAKSTKA